MIIIQSVPKKAVSTLMGIIEKASPNVKCMGTFKNDPYNFFAEYQSGRDVLAALDRISVWVGDKWPSSWGPRPSVKTNLGREAKPATSFGAPGQAIMSTCILRRPAGCRAWGAASSWREHDIDLAVTVE